MSSWRVVELERQAPDGSGKDGGKTNDIARGGGGGGGQAQNHVGERSGNMAPTAYLQAPSCKRGTKAAISALMQTTGWAEAALAQNMLPGCGAREDRVQRRRALCELSALSYIKHCRWRCQAMDASLQGGKSKWRPCAGL